MTPLDDAHNHLHDPRLQALARDAGAIASSIPLRHSVVNGTSESDWNEVAALASRHVWIIPSFGLHPWFVEKRSADWAAMLEKHLLKQPNAAVGEIGLDRWIENPDIDAQRECFVTQLNLARKLDRPVTIHCLKAWGLLEEILRDQPPLPRGFLLHSYGGSREMIPGWVQLGAYFSLSPHFAHERKTAQLETFQHVPTDRLLIETDAPDMRPPDTDNPHPLKDPNGHPINHPANLTLSFELAVRTCGVTREQLAANFERLFLRR